MTDERLKGLQIRLTAMEDALSELEKTMASFTLTLSERQLVKVKQAVAKYGPKIRVIGG